MFPMLKFDNNSGIGMLSAVLLRAVESFSAESSVTTHNDDLVS